ncbi:MAG: hypothetical protein ISR76_07865 [Planctomycetes bacterium]|nr:hypothetical protein [Planctomycetota bacterium]
MTAARPVVAVIGLEDGPEAGAGPGVLACLDAARWRRLGVVAGINEAGAYRPGILDEVVRLPAPGAAGFLGALLELVRSREVRCVLPGSAAAAAALAAAADELREAGVGLRLARPRDGQPLALAQGCRRAGVACLEFHELPAGFIPASFRLSLPAVIVGPGGRARAYDEWEAQRAAERLAAAAGPLACATFDPTRVFQVAVLAEAGRVLAAGAVRVLADDCRMRPWLALTVDSPALLDAASRLSRAAELDGPAVLHFHQRGRAFLAAGVDPGFPMWVEVCRLDGPNLVELSVRQALGEAVAAAGVVPAGGLFSQTSDDLVVAADHPVRASLAGAQPR